MIIKCIPTIVEEKVDRYYYRFVDRDGNTQFGNELEFKKVQEGGRIYFTVPERHEHYVTLKHIRRRPVDIYKISIVTKTEKLT